MIPRSLRRKVIRVMFHGDGSFLQAASDIFLLNLTERPCSNHLRVALTGGVHFVLCLPGLPNSMPRFNHGGSFRHE
jgi:hypothetical protein